MAGLYICGMARCSRTRGTCLPDIRFDKPARSQRCYDYDHDSLFTQQNLGQVELQRGSKGTKLDLDYDTRAEQPTPPTKQTIPKMSTPQQPHKQQQSGAPKHTPLSHLPPLTLPTTPRPLPCSRSSLLFATAILPPSPSPVSPSPPPTEDPFAGLAPGRRNAFTRLLCCFGREERARRRVMWESRGGFEKVGEGGHWSEF